VGTQVEVTQGEQALTPDASPMRPEIMRAITRAVAAADPGAAVVPTQASYATDGAVFRSYGIPTYGCGGVFIMDSEEFAHGLDERIRVGAFYDALTYWTVLLKSLAGG
jgi:acetylornithine deacetylase/succinyl-diaminopimelate desuccinylase-like protein